MSAGTFNELSVRTNDLTLCHKHATGYTRSTMPDVCKSPVAPVPYTNIAYARDLENGTVTVRSNGGAMNGVKGSRFFPSYGDEPGTSGGVISGVNQHEATWLSWSPNVFMEGRAVTRLTDKMLMNRGNTVSIGGYYTGNSKADRNLLDTICDFACQCYKKGNQKCVDRKLDSKYAGDRDANNGVWPEATYNKTDSGWELNQQDGFGAPIQRSWTNFPSLFKTAPDVTVLNGGTISDIIEIKFDDTAVRYSDGTSQFDRYEQIAAQHHANFSVVDFHKNCKCPNNEEERQSNPSKSRVPQPRIFPPLPMPPRLPPFEPIPVPL